MSTQGSNFEPKINLLHLIDSAREDFKKSKQVAELLKGKSEVYIQNFREGYEDGYVGSSVMTRITVSRKAKKMGMKPQDISTLTGLSEEEISRL